MCTSRSAFIGAITAVSPSLALGSRRWFRWDDDGIEWTAEANPNSLTRELARAWRAVGVTRLSLGVQSFDDRVLRWLGRIHRAEEALAAVEAARVLTRAGYVHYEVSNYAMPGFECRHNWRYWNGAAYLGVGPSAHSYLPPYRMWNVFRWSAYREKVAAGQMPCEGWERVTGERRGAWSACGWARAHGGASARPRGGGEREGSWKAVLRSRRSCEPGG
ncbi:MAG: radical SAM protein [Gemmatimonadota bacterium]